MNQEEMQEVSQGFGEGEDYPFAAGYQRARNEDLAERRERTERLRSRERNRETNLKAIRTQRI
jgi:hypothetical protein